MKNIDILTDIGVLIANREFFRKKMNDASDAKDKANYKRLYIKARNLVIKKQYDLD